MKSETKQYIRENFTEIYLSFGMIVIAIAFFYWNLTAPAFVIPEGMVKIIMNIVLVMDLIVCYTLIMKERFDKMEKTVEDLQEHIERLGFSDKEE